MFSRSLFSLSLLFVLLAASTPAPAQAATGATAFNEEGFPTIAIIGIVVLLALAILGGFKHGGLGALKSYIIFTIFNAYIWLAGFFLIFGPDTAARVEILGLTLAFLGTLGFYAVMVNYPQLFLLYSIFAVWNTLSLLGANTLFSFNGTPVWQTTTAACNTYFVDVTLTRCEDDNFLQFLRVIGTSVILFVAATALQSFVYWIEAGNKANGYGRGAATNAQQQPSYNNNSVGRDGREGQGLVVQPQPVYTQPPPV